MSKNKVSWNKGGIEAMQYDPIKRSLGVVFNATPLLRVVFYKMLDVLLLRSWYIRRELNRWNGERKGAKARILDAGSGFGQYTHRMAKLSEQHEITGVDVKEEQIDDCNGFFQRLGMGNRVHFEVQDLTRYVNEGKYDLILSVDVMEHILEDSLEFENFNKSLASGGMLLISTPSDLGGSDSEEHDDDEAHGFVGEHVRDGYNIEDIKEKLTAAGFRDIDARYSYGTAGHISWVLSMKWPIVALNATKLFFILLPIYYLVVYPWCLLLNVIDVMGTHSAGTGLIVKATK